MDWRGWKGTGSARVQKTGVAWVGGAGSGEVWIGTLWVGMVRVVRPEWIG